MPRYLSKLEGLLRIEEAGLPHPNWLILNKVDDLPAQGWTVAPEGWTVRCCPRDFYEFQLPSQHYLEYGRVRETICEFQSRLKKNIDCVVYPSWKFICSGGALVSDQRLSVEIIEGYLEPLLQGKKTPDVSFEYSILGLPRLLSWRGRKEIIAPEILSRIVKSCFRLSTQTTIVLEWSNAIHFGLLFHDWVEEDYGNPNR